MHDILARYAKRFVCLAVAASSQSAFVTSDGLAKYPLVPTQTLQEPHGEETYKESSDCLITLS